MERAFLMSVTEKQSAPASGMLICQPLTKETQKGKFQVDIQQERGGGKDGPMKEMQIVCYLGES